MSKYTEYSFSELIDEFARMQNNSIETIQKLNETLVSQQDAVTITLTDEDGVEKTYNILSYNFFKSAIDRIDNTLEKMLGLDDSEAYMRMPDGSYQKIYTYRISKEPDEISEVSVPTGFSAETNWFFESMLSPGLFISIDLSNYLELDATKVRVKRVIVKTNSDDQIEYFNTNYKNKNNINHDLFIDDLTAQDIFFIEDEETKDLPLSTLRYAGEFVAIKSEDSPTLSQAVSTTNNTGVASTSGLGEDATSERTYLFDKVTYTDNVTGILNGKTLSVEDKLMVADSIYRVAAIDYSTNYVKLKRISGFDAIPIATENAIYIYSEAISPKSAKINIGYDERLVIFFKAINDEFNVANQDWSPGFSIYSNELLIQTSDGEQTLEDFYFENVADFGKTLISNATEKYIPAIDGETPDAPVLDANELKVVQINKHKLNDAELDDIRKKGSAKNKLYSEIKELDASIEQKKEQLNIEKFNTSVEKRGVQNELQTLISEKTSKSSLYASLVKEIAVLNENVPSVLDAPKYRVRGFFDIPEPKTVNGTLPQNVVQFNVRYRYLKLDGNTTGAEQFEFTNKLNQVQRGSFSPWNDIKSDVRKREFDENLGYYVWSIEDVENAENVNINQIDIPISKGEKVEVQIQSLSEAGWPMNPLKSDWSESVIVDFPESLNVKDETEIILEESQREKTRVDFEEELNARGLDSHLLTSVVKGDTYWAHDLSVISSGFFTNEGNVISGYEIIKQLKDELAALKQQIEVAIPELELYLIDEDTDDKILIKNNSTVDLFAGYYTDFIDQLSAGERKGAIITKVYTLGLKNNGGTILQLISRFPGGLAEDLPDETITPPDADYLKRRYDKVPIMFSNISADDTKNDKKVSRANHASAQLASQFIYGRFKNIGLKTDLYADKTEVDRFFVPDLIGTAESFVWDFLWDGSGNPIPNGKLSEFCVHVDFPNFGELYQRLLGYGFSASSDIEDKLRRPDIEVVNGEVVSDQQVSYFKHSYGFNLKALDADGKKQLSYNFNFPSSVSNGTNPLDTWEYPDKFGFYDYDRYLIGKNTCGSYLYLAPQTLEILLVDGTDYRAKREIKAGDDFAIEIPVLYQFRMTDYYGDGDDNGLIGGWRQDGNYPTNLTYEKRIGFDIYEKDKSPFSFDIKVTSKYGKETLLEKVNIDKSAKTISDTVSNLSISKTDINNL